MLGWSINLFRVRGIMISLHYSFLLLLAYTCDVGWRDAGWLGLWWSAAITVAFFTCVVLHEFGHSFTAMRFGVRVQRILLMPIGGMAEFDRIPRKPSQELLVTAAGPAVNFAIAGVLWCVLPFPPGWNLDAAEYTVLDLLRVLAYWNLMVGVFNLLPAFPMDGGRILRAMLALRLSYVRATYWAATLAALITVPAALWSLYTGAYLRAALFVFIFMAGRAEYQGVRRREEAEARWREQLIRTVSLPPASSSEPTVLGP